MKRYGDLWTQITSYENILAAHRAARKGKSHYSEVKMVNSNEDYYIKQIQIMLLNRTFTTSEYEIFEKNDGKKVRTLYKLPYFPDRIVQHALLQIVGPIWSKSFIRDTFQSIPGRGTHDARKRVEKAIKKYPNCYILKFDIEKYYPNVNNDILKDQIRKKIKCKNTLWLLGNIIDSANGIPIGNYSSQYFGNLYLSSFDWWVVQTLKPLAYFRYCDDIVLFAEDSKICHILKTQCFQKLSDVFKQKIKNNWQVFPLQKRKLDYLGFVFSSDGTKLRKWIAKRFVHKVKEIKTNHNNMTATKIINGLYSYWGWCKPVKAKKLWFSNTQNFDFINIIKTSKEALKQCK